MKMVFMVYSQAADAEILAALKQEGIPGYTKLGRACGEGNETEPKLHTHTWPGENSVVFIALDDTGIEPIKTLIRQLKHTHPRAGVKGFILPMEEII
ncbi:MAG: PG0541 family transporter-associated protein [Syntrophaceae bacterium]